MNGTKERVLDFLSQYLKWLSTDDPDSIELPDKTQTRKLIQDLTAGQGISEIRDPDIYLEGNKGGDYIAMKKLDEDLIIIDTGHCCVREPISYLTVEMLTSLFVEVRLKHNKKSLFAAIHENYMKWDEDVNRNFILKAVVEMKKNGLCIPD